MHINVSVTSATTLIKLGIFKDSECDIANVVIEGTITITSSFDIEFGGLVHTLTKSLSYVTSLLHMIKDTGTLSASGNIAAVINTNHKYDIHHIVLSGYL